MKNQEFQNIRHKTKSTFIKSDTMQDLHENIKNQYNSIENKVDISQLTKITIQSPNRTEKRQNTVIGSLTSKNTRYIKFNDENFN